MGERLAKIEKLFHRGSETVFYALLALEIVYYLICRVWWNVSLPYMDMTMAHVRLVLYLAAHWIVSLAVSLCVFAENTGDSDWRQRIRKMSYARLILMMTAAIAVGCLLRLLLQRSEQIYSVTVSALLILLSCGKNHAKMIRMFFALFAGTVAVAGIGLLLGFTCGAIKVGAYGTGFSLGMTYPNTWARTFFIAVLLCWYLWLQGNRPGTFALFWLAAVPVLLIAKCRTIAVLMILFPLMTWLKDTAVRREKGMPGSRRVLAVILIIMPFLCFALTMLLSSQMEHLVKLTYGNYLRNMSKRFVQAGIAIREYGLPLFGTDIDLGHNVSAVLGGVEENLYILDCGYVSYALTRGIIWLCAMMAWQSFANYRCLKNGDYGMLLIGISMSLLTLMEREGFEPWYNLTLLYPLAETLGCGTAVTWKTIPPQEEKL